MILNVPSSPNPTKNEGLGALELTMYSVCRGGCLPWGNFEPELHASPADGQSETQFPHC